MAWLAGRTTDSDGDSLLTPARRLDMREWIAALGIDPARFAERAALVQRGERYELHLTEFVRNTDGTIEYDMAASLPVSRPAIICVEAGSWPSWLLGCGVE